MSDERLTSENPFESPQVASGLPLASYVQRPQITIADILFCTFAVSLSSMCAFQRWGGFEAWNSIYFASGILVALSASVFFTANRIRLARGLAWSSLQPGHCVALLGGGYLASYVFQFLVSFLELRHVGAPIHILSSFSSELINVGLCILVLFRTSYTPRWRAFFFVACAYSVIFALAKLVAMAGDRTDLLDPFTRAAMGFWYLGDRVWYLCGILLVVAYVMDKFTKEVRDWLHEAGVLSVIAAGIASVFSSPFATQIYWTLYNEYFSR